MGGISKHMKHLYDLVDMDRSDIISLVQGIVSNDLELREKTDGLNIHVLARNDEIRFARTPAQFAAGGFGYDDIDRMFDNLRVRSCYKQSYMILHNWWKQARNLIASWFNDGEYTLDAECILGGTTNMINYSHPAVIIHGICQWSGGKIVRRTNHYMLAYLNDGLVFYDKELQIGNVDVRCALNRLVDVMGNSRTIRDYLKYQLVNQYIYPRFKAGMGDWVITITNILYQRVVCGNKSRGNRISDLNRVLDTIDISKDDREYIRILFSKDPAKLRNSLIEPIVRIFIQLENQIIRAAKNSINDNNDMYDADIRTRINLARTQRPDEYKQADFECSGDLEPNRMEGIVVTTSDGELVKLTGNFGAINRLIYPFGD